MQCVTNTLFQTLEQVFGRIKFSVYIYRSIFVLTGRFLHKHLLLPLEVASLSQQGRMATVSWLPNYVHSNRKCTGQVIPFGNHFLQSYPIHRFTPRDLKAADSAVGTYVDSLRLCFPCLHAKL